MVIVLSVSTEPLTRVTLNVALERASLRNETPTHIVVAAPITPVMFTLIDAIPAGVMGSGLTLLAAPAEKIGDAFAVLSVPVGAKTRRAIQAALLAIDGFR